MFYSVLAATNKYQDIIDSDMFSPERWALAGEMIVVGMGMIFAVLATLWGVLAIFKLIFAGKTPKEPKAAPAPKTVAPAPVVETVPVAEASDDALVAVITAAVAAYIAEEEPGAYANGFRVVSFRRTGTRSWNAK